MQHGFEHLTSGLKTYKLTHWAKECAKQTINGKTTIYAKRKINAKWTINTKRTIYAKQTINVKRTEYSKRAEKA